MRVWSKAGLLLVPVAAVAFGLFSYAPRMRPIRDGSAEDFWKAVSGLDSNGRITGFYLPREGWFIFTVQGMHAEFPYRVRGEAVRAALPQWLPRLDSAGSNELRRDVPEALALWKRADPGRGDPVLLMRFIRQVRLERLRHERLLWYEYYLDSEKAFDWRWAQAKRYGLNILAEFVYLSGLIVFAVWPWLRNGTRLRWAIHLGLVPFLLLLPYFLGYAPLTFTSAGPSGGVLYPWIIIWFRRLYWTRLDGWILEHTWRLLAPLSQDTGPWLALSGMGGTGPLSALGLGLLVGCACYGAGSLLERLRAGRSGRRAGPGLPST